MDKKELQITSDGSHTIYVPELDETYHSSHGAIQEAMHVFIDAGFYHLKSEKELNILEVGFGTGLNTFLTLLEVSKQRRKVNYTAIEAYPLDQGTLSNLNYTNQLNSVKNEVSLFKKIHEVDWEKDNAILDYFNLKKIKIDLTNEPLSKKYNLIYFDAFGPRAQPEMWTKSIFEKIYNSLDPEGILVTYCAKGSVKRTLKEVGFRIENLPGPPGKREMTRAIK